MISKLKINPGAFGFSKEQWNAIVIFKYPELEEVFFLDHEQRIVQSGL